MTRRVALIVRYLLPDSRRVSGLAAYARCLADELAGRCELHVVTDCTDEQAEEWAAGHSYHVHAVPHFFWLRAGGEAIFLRPQHAIVMSGFHRAGALAALLPLSRDLKAIPSTLYQAVQLDRPVGWLGRRVADRFGRVACSTEKIRTLFPPSLSGRCAVVHPGRDIEAIRSMPPAKKGRAFRVGYFNHLNALKGLDVALEAFREVNLPDAEFVITGTGPLAGLARQADGSGGVRFLGYLDDPMPDLKACDVVVMPLRTDVSVLGVADGAIACLAAGVPVIATDVNAVTAAVRDEEEGLIMRDPHELAACIRRLHDDRELRDRLARNAADRADEFRIERSVDLLMRMMDEGDA